MRLVLLAHSPRGAAGLLSRAAWNCLDELAAKGILLAADLADPLPCVLAAEGFPLQVLDAETATARAAQLLAAAAVRPTLWIESPDGDPGLREAIAAAVLVGADAPAVAEPVEVEVLVGAWDVPGARLLDAVAVMDRLRSPGGCPWDAEQTHESLSAYLIEEAAEAVEAIQEGQRAHLIEELGDVLLQVLFHARLGQEEELPWGVDEVAAGLVEKLVRRHPHVFADATADTPQEVAEQWQRIKAAERAARD